MKKKLVLIILLVVLIQSAYSQNYNYNNDNDPFLSLFSIRVMIPDLESPKVMTFFNIGIGYHFYVVPNLLSFGFYGEVGLGTDWFAEFAVHNNTNNNGSSSTKELNAQFGFNFGFRIYGLLELGIIKLNPFAGYNLVVGQPDSRSPTTMHNPVVGASAIFSIIGIEFCYYLPIFSPNNQKFYHIGFVVSGSSLFSD
ncbi:MAG: hypothetical protein FWD28_06600 [Treponema sp.]|nr:hypothetical protein [Treponema sp.]